MIEALLQFKTYFIGLSAIILCVGCFMPLHIRALAIYLCMLLAMLPLSISLLTLDLTAFVQSVMLLVFGEILAEHATLSKNLKIDLSLAEEKLAWPDFEA